jgi:hypothetical protein
MEFQKTDCRTRRVGGQSENHQPPTPSNCDSIPVPIESVTWSRCGDTFNALNGGYYQWLRLYSAKYPDGRPIAACTPMDKTLMVKRRTQQQHENYCDGLIAAMKESARILKPDGMLVFTFHHRGPMAWHALACALRNARFSVSAITPVAIWPEPTTLHPETWSCGEVCRA